MVSLGHCRPMVTVGRYLRTVSVGDQLTIPLRVQGCFTLILPDVS